VEKSKLPATQKISTTAIKGQANDLRLWPPRNHHDRVTCRISVTAAYYRDWLQKLFRKMHKNWPDLLENGPPILHDNACPHLGKVVTDLLSKYEWEVLCYAPYILDKSPSDFDLFHTLKEPTRGHSFPSLEEVSAAVTPAIRGLKKSGNLNGIANLPKRWYVVTEKLGNYTGL
jgi:hypothetical protein